ncbi:MAG: alpha/beta fold hydrolase [Candidatus Melainabacteria bacterium]|nr:alpha/beta fold hydrolase [Candidatus Melainabacteria bacterium]
MRIGVLLLHGLTGMPSELRPLEKFLQKNGFETEAPVLAGHGGTHLDLIKVEWSEWVESARLALKQLLTRVDKVILCGLSMGGTIASMLAMEVPERCLGVIILSPTLDYDGSNLDNLTHQKALKLKSLRNLLHLMVDTFPITGGWFYWTETPPYGLKDARLQAQITKSIDAAKAGTSNEFGLFRTYFASLHQMKLLTDHFKSVAQNLSCPVLVMHSLEDTLASMNNATEMYKLLGSPDKRLIALTGCDHVMTLDLQRHYVLKRVAEFIERITDKTFVLPRKENPVWTFELCDRLSEEGSRYFNSFIQQNPDYLAAQKALTESQKVECQGSHLEIKVNNQIQAVMPLFAVRGRILTIGYSQKRWSVDFNEQIEDYSVKYLLQSFLNDIAKSIKANRICLINGQALSASKTTQVPGVIAQKSVAAKKR